MRPACVNFVESHTDQLIEMLIADLTAQEICVFLKMCKDEHTRTDPLRITDIDKYHRKPHLRGDWNARKRPMLPRNMLEPGVGDIGNYIYFSYLLRVFIFFLFTTFIIFFNYSLPSRSRGDRDHEHEVKNGSRVSEIIRKEK